MKQLWKTLLLAVCVFVCIGTLTGCELLAGDGHVHVWSELYSADSTYHYQTCEGCTQIKNKSTHSYDEWNVLTPATEMSIGVKQRVCTVCNYTETDVIPVRTHEHSFTIKTTDARYLKSAVTCTEAAVYYYSCACGEIGTDTFTSGDPKAHSYSYTFDTTNHWQICKDCLSVGEKSAHTFGSWSEVTPATLSSAGTKQRICTVCSYSETAEIPVLTAESFFNYTITDNAVTITGVKDKTVTAVTVPATLESKSVTAVGGYAFMNCTVLSSITLPDSITNIGAGAFWNCGVLASISIPANVTSIGDYAFMNCTTLSSVTIPASVTAIGKSAFGGCTSLTSIVFGDTANWYMTESEQNFTDKSGGTPITYLTSGTQNADYFIKNYTNYYWYKAQS